MKTIKTASFGFVICLLAVFLLLNTVSTSAQKANFSGNWTLDEAKSPIPENGFRMGATKMTATQTETNLSMERTYKGRDGEDVLSKENFTLDGKECENLFFQTMKRKSVAAWSADGKVLTISSSTLIERDGETMEMKSTETFKLSDDGKELHIETAFNTPNGDMKSTVVYNKN